MKPWMGWTAGCVFAWIGVMAAVGSPAPADHPEQEVWNFDRLDQIGGHPVTVVGHPHVIDAPGGKAIEFNGVDDGLYVEVHPLAGASAYTYEAIFRPDGGSAEQRWLHMNANPCTGSDDEARMLFEIRVVNDKWLLDAFIKSGPREKALMFRQKLYPLGQWYRTAAVYDGKVFSSYINGELQGSAEVPLLPEGEGRTSVGMRIQKIYFFKGAVMQARFTRHALDPSEFLKAPEK